MKTIETTPSLKARYAELKNENPKIRIREAAKQLNVTEMELLACSIGEGVCLLRSEAQDILKEIHRMGKVMALTRNEYAVHERKGIYDNVSFNGGMGLAVNADIDLRLFMSDWKYIFAAEVGSTDKTLYSIQFFDKKGEAIHKIYSTPESDINAYLDIVEKFKAANQAEAITISTEAYPEPETVADEAVDLAAFQSEWINMEDTHHFFGMLKKHKLQRLQALRLAPEGYTQKVDNHLIVKMLELASVQEVPIMVFVPNRHCIQIHTGKVNKIFPMGNWINVMDPMFNLHLNLDGVAECWIVKKNTKDGIVTSIELFDEVGELIVYCFGERKPGKAELESWRSLVRELENEIK